MATNSVILKQLSGIYQNLKVNSDFETGTLKVGTRYGLKFDPSKDPSEWKVFDATSGGFEDFIGHEIEKDAQVKEFIETLNSLTGKPVEKSPLKNLEAGGFNLSGEPESTPELKAEEIEVTEPSEDQLAKLEAIMNGEVEVSKSPKKQSYVKSTVQKMPAVIPEDLRSKQIKELTLEDITNYICPTATESEAFMFLKLCQARNLNPFLNEAYLIKYGDKATMTVGKEAFMRRAEAHPQFDGYEAGIIIQNADKTLEKREGTFLLKTETLVGGWAKIYRKDRKQAFVSEVALHEYNTGKSLWVSKPATMIRKVAIVQGKREAFPSEFSGMYDAAEMNEGGVIEAVYTEVEA